MKTNSFKIYLLTIASFFLGSSQYVVAGVLDKISESIGISVSAAGQLITAYGIGSAIGTPIVIMLIGKYNQKNQLLLALIISLVGIFLTPLVSGFDLLLFSRFITGIGSSVFIVIAITIASKLAKKGKEGAAISNVVLGFSLSLVLGVPLGRTITFLYNWNMIFYIIGILIFLSSIVIYFVIPKFESQEVMSLKKQFFLLKNKEVTLTLVLTLLVFITFSIVTTYMTPFIFSIENVSEHKIASIFLIFGVASVIGSKLGASLADKIGITPILFSAMAIIILTLGSIFVFHSSLKFIIIALSIWSFAMWMFGPTQNFNISKIIPSASIVLVGLNSSTLQLGMALGAGIGGIAISKFSIESIIWLSMLFTILALFIYLVSLLRIKKKMNY